MTAPLCPYFGTCGGCTLQHLAYTTQLHQKKQALAKATKFDAKEINVFSGNEYFYRNRMDVLFSSQGLGLRKKGKPSEIVPIEKCIIADEMLNVLLREVQTFFTPPFLQSTPKTFSSLLIRSTAAGYTGLCFVLQESSFHRQKAVSLIRDFSSISSAKNIAVAFTSPASAFLSEEILVIKGKELLQEKILDKFFSFPITGFFQNNSALANEMHQHCRELLQSHPLSESTPGKAHLLDLYAGVGTFGLLNADLFQSVVLVESFSFAVKAAKSNAQTLDIKNATFHMLDALRLHKVTLPKPLIVVADPPRTGMPQQTIRHLNQVMPEMILYVSCNPQQLAKELPKFTNYFVKSVALFDFFPQTKHSEAVIELVKTIC